MKPNLLTSSRRALPALLPLLVLLIVSPAWSTISVVGGLSRESVVKPGDKSDSRIVLLNNSDQPQTVRIYQADYQFWCDGRNDYGTPGSTPRSNAKWLTVTPGQVTVAAGATESIYYTINVPQDAALTGTYWSIVMVEPISGEALEPPKPEDGKSKIGLRTVMRYGIQVITQIGTTGIRDMRFADKRLVADTAGRSDLQLDIENTGERWLVPTVWAELFDANGAQVGRFDAMRARIYPGCSVRYRVNLTGVPTGHYKALVVADNGDEHVFGAQYDLDLK